MLPRELMERAKEMERGQQLRELGWRVAPPDLWIKSLAGAVFGRPARLLWRAIRRGVRRAESALVAVKTAVRSRGSPASRPSAWVLFLTTSGAL